MNHAIRSETNFFKQLESLRGLAAVWVVFYHIGWDYPLYSLDLVRNGALMVDIFFVLSGFVIVHSYGNRITGKHELRRFMWHRFGRLYPLHLFMLLIFLGIETLKYIAQQKFGLIANNPAFSNSDGVSFLNHILLIHSFVQESGSYNSASWSISTEFYTYLLFAMLALRQTGGKHLIVIALLISTTALLIIYAAGITSLTFDYGLSIVRCIYGFFIGVATYQVYIFYRSNPKASTTYGVASTYTSLFVLFLILSYKSDDWREFLVPLATAFLIFGLVTINEDSFILRLLRLRVIEWLGKISYSIYMTHLAIIWVTSQVIRLVFSGVNNSEIGKPEIHISWGYGTFFALMTITVVLIVSKYTFQYIEDPFRKLAKKIY